MKRGDMVHRDGETFWIIAPMLNLCVGLTGIRQIMCVKDEQGNLHTIQLKDLRAVL